MNAEYKTESQVMKSPLNWNTIGGTCLTQKKHIFKRKREAGKKRLKNINSHRNLFEERTQQSVNNNNYGHSGALIMVQELDVSKTDEGLSLASEPSP